MKFNLLMFMIYLCTTYTLRSSQGDPVVFANDPFSASTRVGTRTEIINLSDCALEHITLPSFLPNLKVLCLAKNPLTALTAESIPKTSSGRLFVSLKGCQVPQDVLVSLYNQPKAIHLVSDSIKIDLLSSAIHHFFKTQFLASRQEIDPSHTSMLVLDIRDLEDDHRSFLVQQIEKESFSERWSNSRFWLVRGSYVVLRAVWTVVMVIGGFIAWLISLLFI